MNQQELEKRWQEKIDEQIVLVQEWIDNPDYFSANKDDELTLLEELMKEAEEIEAELDIQRRTEWLGPRWYQIATGWAKAKSVQEQHKALELYNEFKAFSPREGESKHKRFERFTQIRINGARR